MTATVTGTELKPVPAPVADVPGRIVAAWAAHDSGAFADVFADDASMILPGVHQVGHDAIRTFMQSAFAGPYAGTQVTGTPISAQLLAPGVAVVITDGGILHPGETDVAPERAVRATWIVVERGGTWKLAAYQNTPKNML